MPFLFASVLLALAPIFPPKAPPPAPTYAVVTTEVTAYTSDPAQTDDTPLITASGSHVHPGTLACPPSIAFGTQVIIEGQTYTCEDRMNRKYADRFDIWMAANSDAIAWGIKTVDVKVLSTQQPLATAL